MRTSSIAVQWTRQWAEADGFPARRLGRDGDMLVAQWEGLGTLRAERSGRWGEFVPESGVDASVVEKHRCGIVQALLRDLRGGLTLHASAVAAGGKAIAFLGDSGSGKSTIAAHLCRHRGLALVADDCLPLALGGNAIRVEASHEAHWLDAAAAKAAGFAATGDADKRAFAPTEELREPARLVAAVWLDFDEDAREQPAPVVLKGHRKFFELSRACFRFGVDEGDAAVRDLEQLAAMAESVGCFRLPRPRRFESLAASADAALALLGEWGRHAGDR